MRGRGPSLGCFAALSSVEPPILDLVTVKIVEGDKPWRRSGCRWLRSASAAGCDSLRLVWATAEWLDGAFSAGDFDDGFGAASAAAVGILDEFPTLAAYVARGEARPAYQRAFAAQLAINAGPAPT